MALTERQQEVANLLKQGKKVTEIAQILGISTNAVYQNKRRMKQDGKAPTKRTTGAKPVSKSAGKTAATGKAPSAPGTAPNGTDVFGTLKIARPLTPLQSIRSRRDEINTDIKGAEQARDIAERAFKKAQEAVEKVSARYAEELGKLDSAEAALTGNPVAGPAKVEPAAPAAPRVAAKPPTPPRPKTGAKAGSKSAAKNGSSGSNGGKAATTPPAPVAAPQAPVAATPAPDPAPSEPTTQVVDTPVTT